MRGLGKSVFPEYKNIGDLQYYTKNLLDNGTVPFVAVDKCSPDVRIRSAADVNEIETFHKEGKKIVYDTIHVDHYKDNPDCICECVDSDGKAITDGKGVKQVYLESQAAVNNIYATTDKDGIYKKAMVCITVPENIAVTEGSGHVLKYEAGSVIDISRPKDLWPYDCIKKSVFDKSCEIIDSNRLSNNKTIAKYGQVTEKTESRDIKHEMTAQENFLADLKNDVKTADKSFTGDTFDIC